MTFTVPQLKEQFYSAVRKHDTKKLQALWDEHKGVINNVVLLRNGLIIAAKADDVEMAQWLVSHGADPNDVDPRKNHDALASAVIRGSSEVLEFFLSLGSVQLTTKYLGQTLVHLAVQNDTCKMHDFELLIAEVVKRNPALMNARNNTIDSAPTPLGQAVYAGKRAKIATLMECEAVDNSLVTDQAKKRFIVRFPERTYTPAFFIDSGIHAPINMKRKSAGYSTYNSRTNVADFARRVPEMGVKEKDLQNLRFSFMQDLLLQKLDELVVRPGNSIGGLSQEEKLRLAFFIANPIAGDMPYMNLPFISDDLLSEMIFGRARKLGDVDLFRETFGEAKKCMEAIHKVGEVRRALEVKDKKHQVSSNNDELDFMAELQVQYDAHCETLGLPKQDITEIAMVLGVYAEKNHLKSRGAGVTVDVDAALSSGDNIDVAAVTYHPFEQKDGVPNSVRVQTHAMSLEGQDRLGYFNNFIAMNLAFLQSNLSIGMFGFFLESFSRCPIALAKHGAKMAQSLLRAGVCGEVGSVNCKIAEQRPGLNSMRAFIQSLTDPQFEFDESVVYDPDVEVAVGTTFGQYVQDGLSPLGLFQRQLQNQNFAAFFSSVVTIPFDMKKDGAVLAQTVLASGRGGEHEKALNSIAMFLLFRVGDPSLNQHANIETDPSVLVQIDKTYEHFSGMVRRQLAIAGAQQQVAI